MLSLPEYLSCFIKRFLMKRERCLGKFSMMFNIGLLAFLNSFIFKF